MKTTIRSALGTVLLAAMTATSGSAAAQEARADAPAADHARLTGQWTEPVDKNRPGITFYIQKLTFTADGRFEQINDVICNQDDCPAFRIGMNTGTYRTEGRTIHLDGNLSDLHGAVRSSNTIVLDKHVLHRTTGEASK
ncbi:hypothetical protein NRK68_33615 [Streptomyces yangpuensis]|uniref:Uncharacterized protein n=1 Tax=Streptomyces yangpuensis TaxID=1648182 RepID=A0ABY5Q6D4_9ACTN|nr:hypothetical protein [Streptomyces yangpuensis]MBZ9600203.1 hypothetical protein [Streptomyces erythrochromogenes]UUY51752.1 hypothetical protein NRK68_33615 [Streptomyces yangpuensis]